MRKEGFTVESGKGSHTNWRHALVPGLRVTLSGHDGDDAWQYHVEAVRDALAKVREARARQP